MEQVVDEFEKAIAGVGIEAEQSRDEKKNDPSNRRRARGVAKNQRSYHADNSQYGDGKGIDGDKCRYSAQTDPLCFILRGWKHDFASPE
ncbi:hypothetical protein [Sedimenticola sp.]|uniref:hypothetical protein n=1 Tax=Sedimenticola sp. TaxID=1940285 RepID=UPI003D120ACB